jgi:hypothetical protein
MTEYFMPYQGKKPYVFVSYSHRDSDRVLHIIFPLHIQRYRVWYDEGIPAGCDWPKNIASHMRDAAAVLFFVSASSFASINCLNEIKEALRQQKPVLSVKLDNVAVPAEWIPLLEKTAVLEQKDENKKTLDLAILDQGIIGPDFLGNGLDDPKEPIPGFHFNFWMLVAVISILLLVATAVGTYGLANNWFDAYLPAAQPSIAVVSRTPAPTATSTAAPTINLEGPWVSMLSEYAAFPDDLQERAVRTALDQPDGDILQSDLLNITQLHFCGNMVLQSDAGIAFDSSGNCSVNSAPVIQGSISDLSLIANLYALEQLSLVYQSIESLDKLAVLTRLTELNAAGNPIQIIGDLSGMLSLQTLRLEHTNIQDLSALNGLPQLKTVTVSADMFPLDMDAATQKYDVVLVN